MKTQYLAMGLGFSLSVGMLLPLSKNLFTQTAHAVELSGGRTAFLKPPQFLDAFTTNDYVMRRRATYFFTLDLPADADAALQSVVIAPQNLTRYLAPYRLEQTTAFTGPPREPEAELTIDNVSIDENTQAVTIDFDPPVNPGNLVTIGLRPQRNPRLDGIYVFRITTIPVGDQPQAHIAGHGRLNFIDNDSNRIYR
ncbi:MAG: DUF2808 domain-containing protein [Leptolyngbyaceae cyanobacterium MAG.088]|nr:DUF2808 domain-containing protein [Leptolyngbyaceae cyanobacterium MAG.088]